MSVRQNGVIIAGSGSGSVDVDNSTITTNAMDEIQAVATINANTAAGATNPVYDWVGTLAEHQAQNIETLHPDWICYITDDINGGTSVYTKSEVDTLLTGKVNTGHELIAYQAPTSGNNYTWYRKYADGWVEQGVRHWNGAFGTSYTIVSGGSAPIPTAWTLPIPMSKLAASSTEFAGDAGIYTADLFFQGSSAVSFWLFNANDHTITIDSSKSLNIYVAGIAA